MPRIVAALSALLAACEEPPATPLGVTLADGQVLIGEVTTDAIVLRGALGAIEVPLADIGVILPVEGRTLGDGNGHVTVWLRNGSELRGEWSEPELAMGILAGGERVNVDLPTEDIQALQLQAAEQWPENGLFRVRTSWGDDFLVDPAATRVTLANDLGEFSPFLSECRAIGPIGEPDGDWRIELLTGTVLLGRLRASEIAFALPMGPGEVRVPLDKLVSLAQGAWTDAGSSGVAAPMAQARESLAEPALRRSEGWFENQRMQSAKSSP